MKVLTPSMHGLMTYLFLCLVAMLGSCTIMTNSNANSLTGSEWGPMGKPERFVQFRQDGQVSGHGGCNRFFGSFEQTGNKLSFGPLASTKKFCQDIMDAEREFLSAFERTSRFQMDAKKRVLILLDRDGNQLMKLRQRDWD